MKIFTPKIRGRKFKLAVATNQKDKVKGLSGTKNLKPDAGMMFLFDGKSPVTMNTYKMKYSLDMVFLDKDYKVVESVLINPKKEITVDKDVKYVLEFNAGTMPTFVGMGLGFEDAEDLDKYLEKEEERMSEDEDEEEDNEEKPKDEEDVKNVITSSKKEIHAFKRGGKVSIKTIERELKAKDGAMQVLDDEGVILMNIIGGERIFSRVHTKELVSMAKKVADGSLAPEKLGKRVKEIIDIQNTQDPEYVYE